MVKYFNAQEFSQKIGFILSEILFWATPIAIPRPVTTPRLKSKRKRGT
jgi:hypothetical protein